MLTSHQLNDVLGLSIPPLTPAETPAHSPGAAESDREVTLCTSTMKRSTVMVYMKFWLFSQRWLEKFLSVGAEPPGAHQYPVFHFSLNTVPNPQLKTLTP